MYGKEGPLNLEPTERRPRRSFRTERRTPMPLAAASALLLGLGAGLACRGPTERLGTGFERRSRLPDPTPAPSCVTGALVRPDRICGLGVAGRAFRWNDRRMRALAERRAAENLAGMLRSVVTTAQEVEETQQGRWSKVALYVEIDDRLVDDIRQAADVELWFDVEGTGPFRATERTYACACLEADEAGIRIDPKQAHLHAIARQYPVDEVPEWLTRPDVQNRSLRCAVGYQPTMFHPEEMLGPLTERVRAQLLGRTRSWVLAEFDERTLCRPDRDCASTLKSLVQAANEGVSRGVALTSVWLDAKGIGPNRKKMSAYGWGCVFDRAVLEAARRRLQEVERASPGAGDGELRSEDSRHEALHTNIHNNTVQP